MMKKYFSLFLAILFVITIECSTGIKALAEFNSLPILSIEISDYLSNGKTRERSGTAKYCATIGDRIAVSFILEGVESIDCYQLSGTFDSDTLLPCYYSSSQWITGDEEQEFNTVIAGSAEYTNGAFEDSFSYTRINDVPMLCLIGFALDNAVPVGERITLATVGFEVLDNINNIYNEFLWDDDTMISVSIDEQEYTFENGLSLSCIHNFVSSTVAPKCDADGYTLYTCTKCGYEYKSDYIASVGHHQYELIDSNSSDFSYKCNICNDTTTKTPQELRAIWSEEYINKSPLYSDNSCFLELHKDNIINAKDFAQINM